MAQIYALKIDFNNAEHIINRFISRVDAQKKTRIGRFVKIEDSCRCLMGDVLARYALGLNFGLPNNVISYDYNNYGKPQVIGLKDAYFNVSHSGNWVVCVVDNQDVGIDVQKIDPVDLGIMRNCFSDPEIKIVEQQVDNEKLSCFYKIWALKESYIKAHGKGMSLDLKSFSIEFEHKEIKLIDFGSGNHYEKKHVHYNFKIYDIDYDYVFSVCLRNRNFPEIISLVTPETILNFT